MYVNNDMLLNILKKYGILMDVKPTMIEFDRISGVNCVLLSLYHHKELRATELLKEIKISQDTFYRRTGEWLEKNKLID